jgi:hypothetical protein
METLAFVEIFLDIDADDINSLLQCCKLMTLLMAKNKNNPYFWRVKIEKLLFINLPSDMFKNVLIPDLEFAYRYIKANKKNKLIYHNSYFCVDLWIYIEKPSINYSMFCYYITNGINSAINCKHIYALKRLTLELYNIGDLFSPTFPCDFECGMKILSISLKYSEDNLFQNTIRVFLSKSDYNCINLSKKFADIISIISKYDKHYMDILIITAVEEDCIIAIESLLKNKDLKISSPDNLVNMAALKGYNQLVRVLLKDIRFKSVNYLNNSLFYTRISGKNFLYLSKFNGFVMCYDNTFC